MRIPTEVNIVPRGGFREGSLKNRKWRLGKTVVVRVPEAIVDEVLGFARDLDEYDPGGISATGTQTLSSWHVTADPDIQVKVSRDEVLRLVEQLVTDPWVTRNGKDTGAVRRFYQALSEQLEEREKF